MKTLIIGLLAGGALLASAGVANATPQEDAVVQQIADAGYQLDARAVVSNAYKVCSQLARGYTEQHIVDLITPALNNDRVEAQTFFNISRANLCP
jgi:hypothetical protein